MKKNVINVINPIINIIVFLISHKSTQLIFDFFLHIILKSKGFKNFGSFSLTGEEHFLRFINGYKLDYSLDIGANTGKYSEKIIKLTKSKVLSFEPGSDSFKELKKLEKKYSNKINVFKVALSDKNKNVKFYSIGKNSQLASIEKNIKKFSYVEKKKIKVSKIKCIKGDNFFKKLKLKGKIDFIKIDTEGNDYKVLLGLKKTIIKHKPKFIQFEMNWHNLFNGANIFKISSQFKDYYIYRILPFRSGLIKINPDHPNNNLYHLSNYVMIRKAIKIN